LHPELKVTHYTIRRVGGNHGQTQGSRCLAQGFIGLYQNLSGKLRVFDQIQVFRQDNVAGPADGGGEGLIFTRQGGVGKDHVKHDAPGPSGRQPVHQGGM
jgi:hypothetical protein